MSRGPGNALCSRSRITSLKFSSSFFFSFHLFAFFFFYLGGGGGGKVMSIYRKFKPCEGKKKRLFLKEPEFLLFVSLFFIF